MKSTFQSLLPLGIATVLAVTMGTVSSPLTLRADDEVATDYSSQVKPLLAEYCGRCHGAAEQSGGLRLDNARAILRGGDSGPGLAAGDPAQSRFLQALSGTGDVSPMPPEGEPQPSREQVELVTRWVREGAHFPEDESESPSLSKHRDHWSFQPITRPTLPIIGQPDLARNAIDFLVLTELDQRGLQPVSEANRHTLLRRVYLDLIGLPPSLDEISEFLADDSPGAYEQVVDRLLASPHFGERWGRHWLDLARYADSNGFTRDMPREIWKYREWVLGAMNRGLPFDQFVLEQLAGDLLPEPDWDQQVATGFHRNTLFNEEGGTDPEQFRVERTVDRVNTTATVLLGLSMGCAQCHDHKYDPVSQREYYQLYAFFNSMDELTLDVPTTEQVAEGAVERRAEIRSQIELLQHQFAPQRDQLESAEVAWEAQLTEEAKQELPFQVVNAISLPRSERTEELNRHLYDYFETLPAVRAQFPSLDEIHHLKETEPKFARTMILRERNEPRETHVQLRGDFLQLGVRVEPSTPAVLPPLTARSTRPDRIDLANWLFSGEQPLTARVSMNRVWQHLFGRGLVETENDFGVQGKAPTHPELLDWLAAEWVSNGWDLKRMLRLIVTSAAYRRSSHASEELRRADPENRWLARQSRLRIDSEIIRDTALAASGKLTFKVGGPSVYPPQPEGVFEFTQDKKPWPTATNEDRHRRAMYTYLWRSSPYPAMTVFDFPDANVSCTRRLRSNTPLQSLTLANDLTFLEFAAGLANRMISIASAEEARDGIAVKDDRVRIAQAFQLTVTRPPEPDELDRLAEFLSLQRQLYAADPIAARKFLQTVSAIPPTATDGDRTDRSDSISPDSISPDSISPDSISPDSISPDSVSADSVLPDSVSSDGEFSAAVKSGGDGLGSDLARAAWAERAAWTALARVLFNLDEFITRE